MTAADRGYICHDGLLMLIEQALKQFENYDEYQRNAEDKKEWKKLLNLKITRYRNKHQKIRRTKNQIETGSKNEKRITKNLSNPNLHVIKYSRKTLFKSPPLRRITASHLVLLSTVVAAGIAMLSEKIRTRFARRAPAERSYQLRKKPTVRKILSGVFEERRPACRSRSLSKIRISNQRITRHCGSTFSSRHADKTYLDKFGRRDHRGGGRSSGRETVARVIAGVVAEENSSI